MKIILSWAAGDKAREVMINDVARAFFEAKAIREICVEFPEEWEHSASEVGLLKKSLYGTRDAAANWQKEICEFMENIGFIRGVYNACTYYHEEKQIRTIVHGDDFVQVGNAEQLDWLEKQMDKRFQLKTQKIGRNRREKEGKVLGRKLKYTEEGWEYKADETHVLELQKQMGLEKTNGSVLPTLSKVLEGEDEELPEEEITQYRAIAARCNYLGPDRIDIQYATK